MSTMKFCLTSLFSLLPNKRMLLKPSGSITSQSPGTRANRFLSSASNELPYKEKPHSAIEIDVFDDIAQDSSEFATQLWNTITTARNLGKKSIFMNFPMLQSHYIPIAGMYGFKYHHAEEDNATMVLWLGDGPNTIPIFASHHCGVAGLVTYEDNILVVKEKSKTIGWKLPGGYVNLGEEFDEASVREVFEETGIKAKYRSLLAFRHSHNIQFGRGDMYFICRLDPLSFDIRVDDEIEDAKWMKIKEFKELNKHEMLQEVINLIDNNAEGLREKIVNSAIKTRPPFKFYYTPK